MDWRQRKAIEQKNKQRWLKCHSTLTDESGIYILTREDENGIRYAYVGQAKHILTRLAQHLVGYQHIDLSLKKHRLYNEDKYGWDVATFLCSEAELDEQERRHIKKMADNGYQLRNKTIGGQGKGKDGLEDNKPSKGYYDGKKQGYEDARKFVANLFSKYLDYSIKGQDGKLKQRMKEKFEDFIKGEQK